MKVVNGLDSLVEQMGGRNLVDWSFALDQLVKRLLEVLIDNEQIVVVLGPPFIGLNPNVQNAKLVATQSLLPFELLDELSSESLLGI